MYIIKVVFWSSFIAVFYTYVAYPLLLLLFSLFKTRNQLIYRSDEQLPRVSVLIPAFNEELVIREKISSVLNANYPHEALEIIVGSDHSTDQTNSILNELAASDARIKPVIYTDRTGKVIIMNDLVQKASNPVLILTDANVIFGNDTIYELVKNFKNETISLVDSHLYNTGIRKEGISLQEKTYIKSEVYLKYFEGLLWGSMMGPFGGCYAMRKSFYHPVPENFLVDDFYLNMKVLLKGGKCINELKAVVFEDVSNEPLIEFRRKVRIAAGSYQNLYLFFPVIFRFNAIGFSFLSHKVLRWLGPFLILLFSSCAVLLNDQPFYLIFQWITLGVLLTPFVEYLMRKLFRLNSAVLKFPAHFVTTNVALFLGFFRFLGGIRSSVWQPTKRHQ